MSYSRNNQVSDLAVKAAIRTILLAVGENPDREGLKKTPERVLKAFIEITEGCQQNPAEILSTTFSEVHYDEMVILRDIAFCSTCEHHLLPFVGVATIGYLPNGRVVGLSKLSRITTCFAKRLQVQEQLTAQIAEALMEHLHPLGVGVILKAKHQCMACRGVVQPDAEMVTSSLLGVFKEQSTRSEFLSLARI